MPSEFSPIGRKCVVYSEDSVNPLKKPKFQGEAVGFLEDYLGIEGSYNTEANTILIEWFPKAWIFNGRIRFIYSPKKKEFPTIKSSTESKFETKINSSDNQSLSVADDFFTSSISSQQNFNLPTPTFCSIVRFAVKTGFLNNMLDELVKAPSQEAISQHTVITANNELTNISLVPDLDGMVSKEETGVNWLDTVEHMLIKFPNGSRTYPVSGPILHYSFDEQNAENLKNETLKISMVNLKVKTGNDLELIEQLVKPDLNEKIVLYCVAQVDEEKFIILIKHALDTERKNYAKSLFSINKIEHLLDLYEKNIADSRSGIFKERFNCKFLLN